MNHPMSNSSQSIASSVNNLSASLSGLRANGGGGGGGNGGGGGGTSATHYVNGTGSLGRLKYHTKHFNASDEELDYSQLSQSTHLLGRVKSERFLASKAVDEDRRRRTIIVEKRNESYGFTLQSYGIHYKKDQEMEMITYVDYVEYDGPAYRAGMREGDVILSINGIDLEKADHKTLVDFIKASDSRMRMVVLFEDCVRKVDLHMRYMQLQNMLQSKMNELERVCLRERELLEGKWKTHSLPARKKAITSPSTDNPDAGVSPTDSELPYYRPTLSTEDVANMVRHQQTHQPTTIIPPPAQFMLTYHHYLGDPGYGRYVLKPYSANSPGSGEYFVSMGAGSAGSREGGSGGLVECEALRRSPSDQQHMLLSHSESVGGGDASGSPGGGQQRSGSSAAITVSAAAAAAAQAPPVPPPRTCEKHKPPVVQQQQQKTPEKSQKSGKHCHGHSCNPCLGNFRWKSVDKTMPSANGGGITASAAAVAAAGNGDNVSLDAYDLASPCCDSHCVPTRRRIRHQHKEHHQHKHKHRDRERDSKERPPRPKSQTHMHQHQHYHGELQPQQQQPQHTHSHPHGHSQHAQQQQHVHVTQQQPHQHSHKHQHHHQPRQQHQHPAEQQPQHGHCDSRNGSLRSHYFDLNTGLASHCSLHSCTSSEFAPVDSTASYTTSLSTDTLFWDPKSENLPSSRQHSTKSRQSYQQQQQQPPQLQQQQPPQQQQQQQQQHQSQPHQPQAQHQHQHQQQHAAQHTHTAGIYQHRYHITATQIQPSQIYPNTAYAVHKPKSWDNLTAKAIGGGYGFGYGYLDAVAMKPTVKLQIAQQRHSIPRKNPYGRYSTYTDIENYAPPPQQFVEELTTTTTTTMITAKSTEELIAVPIQPQVANICDCLSKQQQPQTSQQFTTPQQQQQQHQHNNCQMGYYSHLPRPTVDVGTSTAGPGAPSQATTVQTTTMTANNGDISTVSEVTRL